MASNKAYVYTLFKDAGYAIGILASAKSLRLVKTIHQIVVMVTPDIDEDTRNDLLLVVDKVVEVPYIRSVLMSRQSDKQKHRYGSFMSELPTKLNCLSLITYEKIVLLDADTIVVQNPDSLFEVEAPAGIWSFFPTTNGGSLTAEVDRISHGERVPEDSVMNMLDHSFVCWGTGLVLKPNMTDYKKIVHNIKPSFGFPKCHSSIEEQAFAYYYRNNWKKVSPLYCLIPFKNWHKPGELPYIIHLYSPKPWMAENRLRWIDFSCFWNIYDSLVSEFPQLSKYIVNENTKNEETPIVCGWCQKTDHKLFTNGLVSCPEFN